MKQITKWLLRILLVFFLVLFAVSAWKVGKFLVEYRQASKQHSELSQIVEQARQEAAQTQKETVMTTATQSPEQSTEIPQEAGVAVLPEYAELYERNPEFVGWLTVEGTVIDYPVMQSEEPEFYLFRDFDGEYSNHGSLFVRESCDVFAPSDHVTIYGHRKDDGTMFGFLGKYESKEFWAAHPTFRFDTVYEHHTYEVFAVYHTTVTLGEGFEYFLFEDAKSAEEFDAFVDTCRELSFYDTDVEVSYGDKLISLSTCEFSQDNGRLVVVAKRVS